MRRSMTLTTIFAAAAVSLAGFGTTAANAAGSGDTTTTFTVTGTGLNISVPGSATLGDAATGAASLTGQALGNVTVTDGRGALVATWVTTVTSTDFTTGTGSAANQKVTAANVTYNPGLAVGVPTGVGTFVPGVSGTIGAGRTAASWTVGSGNNSATWNPQLSFALSSDQVAGTYTGTVTHSVA